MHGYVLELDGQVGVPAVDSPSSPWAVIVISFCRVGSKPNRMNKGSEGRGRFGYWGRECVASGC